MNAFNREPAYTVTELASARQHQKNWPAIMERAVGGWVCCAKYFPNQNGDGGLNTNLPTPQSGNPRFCSFPLGKADWARAKRSRAGYARNGVLLRQKNGLGL